MIHLPNSQFSPLRIAWQLLSCLVFAWGTGECCAQDTVRVCAGRATTFVADSAGGQLYQWDFQGDGNIDAIGPQSVHTYPQSDSFPVSLSVTDTNGCTNTDTVQLVIIRTQIDSTWTEAASCPNLASGKATLYASGGSGPLNYQWSSGQTGPTATHLPPGIYSIQVSDTLGCTTSTSVTIGGPSTGPFIAEAGSTAFILLNSGPPPDPQPFVTLRGSTTGGTPPFQYEWTPLTGLSNPTAMATVAAPRSSILYTFKVTDQLGCIASDTVRVITVDLARGSGLPLVRNNPRQVYVCHQGITTVANASAACSSPNSLCAHLNHGDLLGPCPAASRPLKNIENQKESPQALSGPSDTNFEVIAFPNPLDQSTTLRFQIPETESYTVKLVSLTGNILKTLSKGVAQAGAPIDLTISANNLSSGVYLAQITTDSGKLYLVKLVISH